MVKLRIAQINIAARNLVLLVSMALLAAIPFASIVDNSASAGTTSWGDMGGFSTVSAGSNHTCALADTSMAYCWGLGGSGQLGDNTATTSSTPVAVNTAGVLAGKTIASISAGASYTCAVASGAAYCWGTNTNGQLGNNSTTPQPVPVTVDASGVLAGKTVTAISAGGSHTCAVASGAAYCWGANANGQLGNNSTTQSLVPVAVDASGVLAGKTVTAISAGNNYTCAVASGAAYCWGIGSNGQLGNNSTAQSLVPVAVTATGVLSGKTVTDISSGQRHVCAVASAAAYCWGSGLAGSLGNNTATSVSSVPVAVDTTGMLSGQIISDVDSGNDFSCVLAANSAAYCWGTNTSGQLGNGSTTQSNVPVAVDTAGGLAGKTVTAVSAGCAVAGTVYCWGSAQFGRIGDGSTSGTRSTPVAINTSTIMPGKLVVSDISAGGSHTCAIASGAAYCWGLGTSGQLGAGSNTSSATPVAVGTTGVLAGKTVTSISAGGSHTCAIASGAAYCWGQGLSGQLGNGTTVSSNIPVAVDTSGVLAGKTVTSISTGSVNTCAVASGAAYCWGDNANGRLGNNSTTASSVPVAVDTSGVLAGKTVTDVSITNSACAVASGAIYCWGSGANGQLGNNSTTASFVPVAVNTAGVLAGKTAISVTAGTDFNCAVASGAAYCWGANTNGQLGNNSTTQALVPVAATATGGGLSGRTVTAISSGLGHTCAIASGAAFCWGLNTANQLGNNSTTRSLVPVAVDNSGGLLTKSETIISAGANHSCTVASSTAYCWGLGTAYQVGDGDLGGTPMPVNMSGALAGKTATSISAGASHTCAVASSAAYCWGAGANGRLGNNAATDMYTPTAVTATGVLSGKTVTAISAGFAHSCAVASGAAYCWGLGTSGQLGTGATTSSNVPVAVDVTGVLAGKTVTAISAGTSYTCAVASGAVYCWGLGTSGQLGNNTAATSNSPVAVDTTGVLAGKTITSISAGASHVCVVASGAAYCWGLNTNGRLGNNSTTQSNVPVAVNTAGVLSGKTVTAISAGNAHTCAIASGAAYCWGLGSSGQLGNGSTASNANPVAVTTTGILSGKTMVQIATGDSYTCATSSDASYCWGLGTSGQFGDSSLAGNTSLPFSMAEINASNAALTDISGGATHGCGLAGGIVYCWGSNVNGKKGTFLGVTQVTFSNPLSVAAYRMYADSTSLTPGAPLAASNTAAQLTTAGQTFRMRFGVNTSGGSGSNESMPANLNAFKLQYAVKSAATCSAQTTGFNDITENTPIAYAQNASLKNRARIAASPGTDPIGSVTAQNFIDESENFTNPLTVLAGQTALWDASLKDNGAPEGTSYCMRPVYSNTSQPLELSMAYPEIRTVGSLSLGIVDGAGAAVASPSVAFGATPIMTTCSLTTGTLGVATQKVRITNTTAAPSWSASIAATSGATASWLKTGGGTGYDFNDPSGSPAGCNSGSDGDGLAGRLTVDPSALTITPQSGCTVNGLTRGAASGFTQGSVDSISLMSANSSTNTGCYWDITNIGLSQRIPPSQAQGTYTLDMTLTVVAQ